MPRYRRASDIHPSDPETNPSGSLASPQPLSREREPLRRDDQATRVAAGKVLANLALMSPPGVAVVDPGGPNRSET